MLAKIVLAASLANLPQPVSESLVAELSHLSLAESRQAVVALTISPAGKVIACRPMASGNRAFIDEQACDLLKRTAFQPAHSAAGEPTYGKILLKLDLPRDAAAKALPLVDVDIAIERLPQGALLHPVAQLALTVDPQGKVESCVVAKSSGSPQLDAVACKYGPQSAPLSPATAEGGVPVRSVQS